MLDQESMYYGKTPKSWSMFDTSWRTVHSCSD